MKCLAVYSLVNGLRWIILITGHNTQIIIDELRWNILTTNTLLHHNSEAGAPVPSLSRWRAPVPHGLHGRIRYGQITARIR
jgi:hypothetical protein